MMTLPTRREFLETTVGAYASTALGARLEARAAADQKPDDVVALSLSDAGDLLQARKLSPVDLTNACLGRIERLNPVLNAFITVTAEQALADARAAADQLGDDVDDQRDRHGDAQAGRADRSALLVRERAERMLHGHRGAYGGSRRPRRRAARRRRPSLRRRGTA